MFPPIAHGVERWMRVCVCVTGVCGGTQKAWDQIAWLSLFNVNSTRKTTHVCTHSNTHWLNKEVIKGDFLKTFVCPGLLLIVRWESFSHCTPTQAVSQKTREARHKGLNWAWTCHFYVLERCKTCQIMQKRKILHFLLGTLKLGQTKFIQNNATKQTVISYVFRPFWNLTLTSCSGGIFPGLQCVGGSLSLCSFEAMRSLDLSPFFFGVCVISYWSPQSALMFTSSRM